MGLEYSVAFRSSKHDGAVLDRPLPGKGLAQEISDGLMQLDVLSEGVFDEEPFWEIRCVIDGKRIPVLVYIFQPNSVPHNAVWGISFSSQVGLLANLFGRNDVHEVQKLARALHEVLSTLGDVRGVRWFVGGNISPQINAGASSPSDLGESI
jgi:hypothetical protein